MISTKKSDDETRFYHCICSECYMYCGVRVEVSGGKAIQILGDAGDPLHRGGVCAKGKNALELIYSPERVLHPMRKVGPRESGKWERISWRLGHYLGHIEHVDLLVRHLRRFIDNVR